MLDDSHLVVRSSLAPLAKRPEGRLFLQLLDQLRFYTRFEINDQTGEALSQTDMTSLHYQRIAGGSGLFTFQIVFFFAETRIRIDLPLLDPRVGDPKLFLFG